MLYPPVTAGPVALAVSHPDQTPTVLALLPDLLQARHWPAQGVLLAHAPGRLHQPLGAACLVPPAADTELPGFGFRLRVLTGWTRRGIGRRLLAGLVAQAAEWPLSHLHQADVADGSLQATWLSAMGFRTEGGIRRHRIQVGAGLARCRQLQDALVQAGRVPPGLTVRPLQHVPASALATLMASAGGRAGPQRLARAQQDEAGRHLSVVLMDGVRPVGLLLADLQDGLPGTTQWLLAPTLPPGWPAVLLLGGYLRQAQSRRHAEARFHGNEAVLAPQHIARQSGARLESASCHLLLAL